LGFILPSHSLSVLAKLLGDERCVMLYGKNLIRFRTGDRTLSSRTIGGDFPNYEMVLPSHTAYATVDGRDFTEAIRRTGLCADGRNHAIRAIFRKNEIELKAASRESGEAEEIIPADLSLERSLEAGFNAHYLRDFLAIAPEGDIRIYFKDAQSQFELRPAQGQWIHRCIGMPIRLA